MPRQNTFQLQVKRILSASFQKTSRGFSLLEVLIVTALIAILVSVSLTFHAEHTQTAHRTRAQSALMQIAAEAENHYRSHWSYQNYTPDPSVLQKLEKHYTFTVDLQPQHYTLTATPLRNDRCGILQLNHQGLQQAEASGCWK